jgi:hypothetical protein
MKRKRAYNEGFRAYNKGFSEILNMWAERLHVIDPNP